MVLSSCGFAGFQLHGGMVGGKKYEGLVYSMAHSGVWSMWLLRNKIIFREGAFDLINLLH